MPEELRIVVTDQGGAAGAAGGAAAPSVPGATAGGSRGVSTRTGGGTQGALAAVTTARGIATTAAAGNIGGAASQIGGLATSAIGGATGLAGGLGVAAVAVAGAFTAAAVAVNRFSLTVQRQVNQLAGLGGGVIAEAQIETELRRFRALGRRGQAIGPELARAERLRSQFEERITDIGTEVLRVLLRILDLLSPFVDGVLIALEGVAQLIRDFLDDPAKFAKAFIAAAFGPVGGGGGIIAGLLKDAIEKLTPANAGALNDPIADLFFFGGANPNAGGPPPPAGGPAPGVINPNDPIPGLGPVGP